MAQWSATDSAAGSVLWAVAQFNKAPTATNRNALFGNTTADAYVTGSTIGQFGVSAAEINTTNTSSEAYGGGIAHSGWNLRIAGSGGRAGRVFYETLVAGGITGDGSDDFDINNANTALLPE